MTFVSVWDDSPNKVCPRIIGKYCESNAVPVLRKILCISLVCQIVEIDAVFTQFILSKQLIAK